MMPGRKSVTSTVTAALLAVAVLAGGPFLVAAILAGGRSLIGVAQPSAARLDAPGVTGLVDRPVRLVRRGHRPAQQDSAAKGERPRPPFVLALASRFAPSVDATPVHAAWGVRVALLNLPPPSALA